MNFLRSTFSLGLIALGFAAVAQAADKTYIVQLADTPAATYTGNVSGYAATQPAGGRKLDVNATAVRAYVGYLDTQRGNAMALINPGNVLHQYQYAFNGFAAKMSDAEVRKLRATPGVRAVTLDVGRPMDTNRTPAFLGISGPGGLWSQLDANGRGVKGENVVIGIVDGGIWPENPSVSDKVDPSGAAVSYNQPGTVVYDPLPAGRWKGTCVAGEGFTPATMCNNKLIGAKFYRAGFAASGIEGWPGDYLSPRDEDGHGSHTMTTSGGNANSPAIVSGSSVGPISGVAPRARVAAYKVCWAYKNPDGTRHLPTCFPSDSIAAINEAVKDGVDVINYSISGSQTSYLDAVEVAFFNAAAAGVFVAASAGNSGPANQVAHVSPWLTTVGASTHDRFTTANVVLGNGASFNGPSFQSTGLPSSPLLLSTNAGAKPYADLSAVDKLALLRCSNAGDITATAGATSDAALDPAKVAGKIVVCTRGGNVLVNKSAAVKAAGGIGMVLQNDVGTNNTVLLIAHSVPTVHLLAAYAPDVKAYAATAGATASFTGGLQSAGVVAPVMADFSSRGPNKADPNVLKPDLTGPGVDIIAGYTNTSINEAQRAAIIAGTLTPLPGADMISGTSMSSPHVAGAAALLKQLHPTWSPAAIKSALMTSANAVKLASAALDPDRWGYGAGHLNPNGAATQTLVYDATVFDYLDYANGVVPPYNLNLASLTIAELIGRGTLRRTVTNASALSVSYSATSNLPGYAVSVVPATLTLAPGASAAFEVQLTRTSAPVGAWVFGDVVWSSGATQVRSPLTVKGSLFAGALLVEDTRAAGSKSFTIGSGYTGTMTASASGLVAATRLAGKVGLGASKCFDTTVPAGALAVRFQLFDSDTEGGAGSDLDLEVYRGATLIGSSGSGTSAELVDLASPAAGTVTACAVGYAPVGAGNFVLSSWVVGAPVGRQTLRAAAPANVTLGGTGSVGLGWSVPSGARYLGVVQFKDGQNTALGSTLVSVDTVPPSAAAAPASVVAPLYGKEQAAR